MNIDKEYYARLPLTSKEKKLTDLDIQLAIIDRLDQLVQLLSKPEDKPKRKAGRSKATAPSGVRG